MTVAASLRASSAAFYRAGHEFSAIMAKEMAAECESMGSGGEALYRHWAEELTERATRFATICPESRVGLDPDADTRQHGDK